MKEIINKIHQNKEKVVIAVTGGGAGAINELLRYGGGSSTLLEAIVPYNQLSFDSFVKGTPDKYCSEQAARDLAMASYQKAIRLENNLENIGIGATCSLRKDNERIGRTNIAYIALQTFQETKTYTLDLTNSNLNRVEQEELVSNLIIEILALNLKVINELNIPAKEEIAKADDDLANLLTGRSLCLRKEIEKENRIIFPGSFNPFHVGHENIAKKTFEITGRKIDLEICVHNVDKPATNYHDFLERTLYDEVKNHDWFGEIHYTALPTFMEKARFFPKSTFVVGWDTFRRISDPVYANLNKVIKTFKENETKFLVFHRIENGKISTNDDLKLIHPEIINLSQIVSCDAIEISSRELRKIKNATS